MLQALELRYKLRIALARLKGMLFGTVCPFIKGDISRLHLGRRLSFRVGPGEGGHIELATSEGFAASLEDPPRVASAPLATVIGVSAHWRLLDPAQSRDTRILLQKGGCLRLFENTWIAHSNYISVGNQGVLTFEPHSSTSTEVQINCREKITIGAGSIIAQRVQIIDYDGHPFVRLGNEFGGETYGGRSAPITIGKNVWIGYGSIILKGVTIGDGSIISAGSVVRDNIPPNCIAQGNPAVVVKEGVTWRKY